MIDIKEIADAADMIIAGYAFTKYNDGIRVLNLNNTVKSAVFNKNDKMVETTMDNMELGIVQRMLLKNKIFMEG